MVLIFGALLIVGMLLYPPWLHVSGSYSTGAADSLVFIATAMANIMLDIILCFVLPMTKAA
jgi:hypothetical protein